MIKTLAFAVVCLLTFRAGAAAAAAFKPLQLHPGNPHYFLFRGKPTVLVASGEHYGAVLNQDFDYRTYLDTLKAEGMNLTRAVPGTSLESTNAGTYRGGDQNTFAPRPGRFLAPWARSDTPGYFYGGNKFDLDRWDETFFRRLKDFVSAASDRGGSMMDLGTLGGTFSGGSGINDSGQITGSSAIAGNAASHGLLYSGGTM